MFQLIDLTGTLTFAVLLIDRSTSMRKFSADLAESFDRHIADLRNSPEAETIVVAVLSFCGAGLTVEFPPMPVKAIPPMHRMSYDAGTPLYSSTLKTLYALLERPEDPRINVVLNVLTDGDDRGSRDGDLWTLRYGTVPAALARGFKLSVIGFGVDGVGIARTMGFEPGLSVNVAGTREGMTSTFRTITKSILN